MSFSKDQEQIVVKILSYKPHQYYEILSVERSASEGEIKKSYRRLAVKLHPDKNPHPRASEAFKFLNKAWGVLSDPGKKKIFDQTGSDPDSRFGGFSNSTAAASGSSFGGSPAFGRGQPFQTDGVFQDDIFNLFFGGGPRAGGPTFSFGGNGFTFHSFGDQPDPFGFRTAEQQRARQRQQQRQQRQSQGPAGDPSVWDTVKQLMPILIILLATLFSTFFAEDSTPEYSFISTSKYNVQRTTPYHKIPFYVSDKFLADKTAKKIRTFEHKVESIYVQERKAQCGREQMRKNDLMEDAQGWFYTDQVRLQEAQNMPMPNCQELRNLGLL